MMTGKEVRERYLKFFEGKGHLILSSASLIPEKDPSLLLIGAGMAPFKPYFTGQEAPPRRRIATCQKCVRTGDLENVGRTARHHTFFEMLGNFSFADYFKEEAIGWAWEFMTEELGLPPEQLWVSIYKDDDEAFSIWHDQVGVPEEKIVRLGKADNFWEIGTGPCGPCSEIYVDLGPERGCGSPECMPGCDCDRYLEIWNLVFTQYDRDEEGNYNPLPNKNIDTGMGLERIASVLQGVPNNYETDLIKPIMENAAQLAATVYGQDETTDISLKVIADHLRGVVYMVGDGILPGNEGRGYVLRRLLRRAVRHGKLLGLDEPFLYKVAARVIDIGKDTYPELAEKEEMIKEVIRQEEERFHETLQAGMNILAGFLKELTQEGKEVLEGEKAFRLYDTYGFPLDLTKEIVDEEGFQVDEEGFAQAMTAQRERARAARRDGDGMMVGEGVYRELSPNQPTLFTGYNTLLERAEVVHLICGHQLVEKAGIGKEVEVVLDRTPFYPEAGGQVGDKGVLEGPGFRLEINNTLSLGSGIVLHQGIVREGEISVGAQLEARVDREKRLATARNHTATHLLHWALRQVFGEHVQQAGSLVSPQRLRFDFSHFTSPTDEELARIEELVNGKIMENISLEITVMNYHEAQEKGAIALFGEKYGEQVRVVKIGDFSIELCGGTHVDSTGSIGLFKFVHEGSVGAGLRRIEAVTGCQALEYVSGLEETLQRAAVELKSTPEEVPQRISNLLDTLKDRDRENSSLKKQLARMQVEDLLAQEVQVEGVPVVAVAVEAEGMEDLLSLVDILKEKQSSGVILLGAAVGGKVNFVCHVSKELVSKGLHAGKIVKEVAQVAGGGGGGRPDLAQAGGKEPAKLDSALKKGLEIVGLQLGQ